jgi:hypothetical protein
MSISDGARLMRASFEVVRRDRALLWFPVISTGCLAITAGFWIFEGAWLYAVSGPALLFVPLAVAGLYSLSFVGVFFSVVLFYLDGKLLFSGHVHSLAGKALLGAVLLCGFGLGVAVSAIRQVFAVSLYRVATAT